MKKYVLLFLACISASLPLFSQTLPATVIMRAAGPVENPNGYKSGYISVGKAMAGNNGELNWKSFIIFDVISAVEDLAQQPDAKLTLAFDWIKSADDVRDINIYYVGCLPKANLIDRDMWAIFGDEQGIEIGQLEAYELASLTQRSWVEVDLKGKIPSGEVSPVNRYMVFRVQSERLLNPEANGLVGMAPELNQHTLTIGAQEEQNSTATGGY